MKDKHLRIRIEQCLALSQASMLAYPNSFPETSCIAVLEAMASGCFVVSTDLAALPETGGGLATLISPALTLRDYSQVFVDEVVRLLQQPAEESLATLQAQQAYIRQNYRWPDRVLEWESLLTETVS